MNVCVDCYTKDEFGVELDPSGHMPKWSEQEGILFLFMCYALRQLSNNTDHLVGDALAGLLDLNPFVPVVLAPSASLFLYRKQRHALIATGMSEREADAKCDEMMGPLREAPPTTKVQYLENEYINRLPKMRLRNEGGDAKKRFIMTVPPLILQTKGFGGLFGDARYYSYMSTFAVARTAWSMIEASKEWRIIFFQAASKCAAAHYSGSIPADQAALAGRLIDEGWAK